MDIGAAGYRRFLDGDDGGIEEIIAAYKEALTLYLAGFCGDISTAEDLMEDVFVKLVVDRPAFRGKSSFKTWLFAIAGNVARDYLRKSRRRGYVPIQELTNEPGGQVLYLTFFEGFSNSEAAKIMRKTNRQVENLLYRAKQSLKSEMRKEGYKYEE